MKHKIARNQGFFGLHFDFHATEENTGIGRDLTEEQLLWMLDEIQPDFIQCDCKGHEGYASYPTKLGNAAPEIEKNILSIWAAAAEKRNTTLCVHYSGVVDARAIQEHPQYARWNKDGRLDERSTSVFGDYCRELMIPQLREIASYGVDGVWVDGECWGANQIDYCEKVVQSCGEDPEKMREFCREGFRRYLSAYIDGVKSRYPNFQVCSNWAFSALMPEPISVPVDFLSGDLEPADSFRSARFQGRCLASQGMPWELMVWGFYMDWTDRVAINKSALQLMQEVSAVLPQGGGVFIYNMQRPDGSIRPWQLEPVKKVADFCRQRQKICHGGKSVAEIGILYAASDIYSRNAEVFGHFYGDQERTGGILDIILDSQFPADIVMEHRSFEHYKLLVIPECKFLSIETMDRITKFEETGGKVLVIGAEACVLFQKKLGIRDYTIEKKKKIWIETGEALAGMISNFYMPKNAESFAGGRVYMKNDRIGMYAPSYYQKDGYCLIPFDMGVNYRTEGTCVLRTFVEERLLALLEKPKVYVHGSHHVDVSLSVCRDAYYLHLVNTWGNQHGMKVFDEIPPVNGLCVHLRLGKAIKVTAFPENVPVSFIQDGDETIFHVQRLELHRAYRLDFQ